MKSMLKGKRVVSVELFGLGANTTSDGLEEYVMAIAGAEILKELLKKLSGWVRGPTPSKDLSSRNRSTVDLSEYRVSDSAGVRHLTFEVKEGKVKEIKLYYESQ